MTPGKELACPRIRDPVKHSRLGPYRHEPPEHAVNTSLQARRPLSLRPTVPATHAGTALTEHQCLPPSAMPRFEATGTERVRLTAPLMSVRKSCLSLGTALARLCPTYARNKTSSRLGKAKRAQQRVIYLSRFYATSGMSRVECRPFPGGPPKTTSVGGRKVCLEV